MKSTFNKSNLLVIALTLILIFSNCYTVNAQKLKTTKLYFKSLGIPDEPLPKYINT